MSDSESLVINVDPGNPGMFFACCGLLELADRISGGAEGWFRDDGSEFVLESVKPQQLLTAIVECPLKNTMSDQDVATMESLRAMKKKDRDGDLEQKKKSLDKRWRESPLVLPLKQQLRLDWFRDSRSGGSRFKTWAGQQSVIDIGRAMKQAVNDGHYADVDPCDWLRHAHGSELTFNFDSDASVQSSPLDVGFSLDPLGMKSSSRPLLELLAFVGLQRFRPKSDSSANEYTYGLWTSRLPPLAASAVCNLKLQMPGMQRFVFPLLYRTKYLKSFLPAKPIGVSE